MRKVVCVIAMALVFAGGAAMAGDDAQGANESGEEKSALGTDNLSSDDASRADEAKADEANNEKAASGARKSRRSCGSRGVTGSRLGGGKRC